MVSYPQLASIATYKFDSAIFSLKFVVQSCFHFRTWRVRIQIFFFFFFFRVSPKSFLKLRASTRVFYTGEISGRNKVLLVHAQHWVCATDPVSVCALFRQTLARCETALAPKCHFDFEIDNIFLIFHALNFPKSLIFYFLSFKSMEGNSIGNEKMSAG